MAQTARLTSAPKIAHVTPVFGPGGGGTGRAVAELVQALGEAGHPVDVFVPTSGLSQPYPTGPFRLHPLKPRASLGKAAWVPTLARCLAAVDLIHLHYPFFGGAESVLRAHRLFRIPYLLTYHTEVVFSSPLWNLGHFLYKRIYLGPLVRSAARAVGVTGAHLQASSAARYLRAQQLAIVPNGVNPTFLETPHSPPPATKVLNLGFCAELAPSHYYKGLDLVLQALRQLPKAQLSILGDGPSRPFYERMTRKLGLADRVQFLGQKSGPAVINFYDSIDILVSPSKIAESFGMVNLEALARGRPVITTSWPATRELAEVFGEGLFHLLPVLTPAAITHAVTSLAKRRHSGDSVAVTRALIEKRFTWQAIAAETWNAYEKILK